PGYDQKVRDFHQFLFNKCAIIPFYCQKYSEIAIRKNVVNFNNVERHQESSPTIPLAPSPRTIFLAPSELPEALQ
ncbi:MAG: hypothetical protein Q8730_02390, partial [Sweet potato little leaf phytoplasma]|nr:hypothetical protein [Sweet potato little leaf phytoplasma]